MKKLTIALLFAVALGSSVLAAEKEILKSEKLKLDAVGELTINKFKADETVGVEILDSAGNKLLDMPSIGSAEKMFSLNDAPTSLAAVDLTGDGVPEVVASAFFGPGSALYVFKFDPESKKFAAIKFDDNPDPEMHREFMVSDLPSDDGKDMAILPDLTLKARGKIYPASTEETVKEGEYFFKFADGAFKLNETRSAEPAGE
ncbi:MAG: hypothetical protein ACOYXC_17040 [Candidatus Rifleibacteriota bacterium]